MFELASDRVGSDLRCPIDQTFVLEEGQGCTDCVSGRSELVGEVLFARQCRFVRAAVNLPAQHVGYLPRSVGAWLAQPHDVAHICSPEKVDSDETGR